LSENFARLDRGVAQIAPCGRSRDDRDPLLVRAADFRRPGRKPYVGHGGKRYRSVGARIDDQVANFLDGGRARIDTAHQHIDLLFLQAIARGHIAAHIGDHPIGDVAHREPEL
jgi:hypothetical protein